MKYFSICPISTFSSFAFPGRPDSVSNCSQLNHSADTIVVHCDPGFDGGLAQLFTLELTYLSRSTDDILVRNVTLSKPRFDIRHLESGVRYEARVYASNRKGRSTPINLRVSTLKRPSEGKRLATISSGSGKANKRELVKKVTWKQQGRMELCIKNVAM